MDGPAPTFAELVARQERVEREVAALRRENDQLRAQRDASPPSAPPPAPRPTPPDGPVGRRQLLRTGVAVAGAAAAGAVLLDATPAAAADSPILMNRQDNSATLATGIGVQGVNAGYGFGVTDNGYGQALTRRPTILAHARGRNFDTGIHVIAEGETTGVDVTGTSGVGVHARSTGPVALRAAGVHGEASSGSGVYGSTQSGFGLHGSATGTGFALFCYSVGGPGASIGGTRYALRLSGWGGDRRPPTQDTVAHEPGELVEDENGNLWLCVGPGTPGTWRKVGGPATAGAFHALAAPVRVYDSRPGSSPAVGPKTPVSAARTLDLKANGSGVPAGATAVMANLLLVNATHGNGNLTIWAAGAAKPAANTLVWGGTAGRFSTLAVTAVDTQARCQIDAGLPTDIVVDIVGYYR